MFPKERHPGGTAVWAAKAASGDFSNHTYRVERDPGREAHESCPNPAFIFFLNFLQSISSFLYPRRPGGVSVHWRSC